MNIMKDSGAKWIGEIPAHWECIKGKYFLRYIVKPTREDDGVITCFRDGEVTLRSNRREEGFTMADKEIGYQGIDVGDLVVHGMDGFAGAIGISDSRGKASPVLNVLDTNQNKKYIMYYLRSMAYGDVFVALATGIRVRSCDLRWNKLSNLLYPIPPIDEQREIAEFLDKKCEEVDGLIADIQKQIDTLEQYKRSTITEAVTKGLNPTAEMKDSNIQWVGKIPTHWGSLPIYVLFEEVTKKNIFGKEKQALQFRYGTIVPKGNFEADDDLYVAKTILNYNIVEPGVIMLNGLNLNFDFVTQRVALVRDKGIITSAYMAIKSKNFNAMTPEYSTYLLKSYDICKAFHNMGGGVRKILNFEELKRNYIIVPPIDEQKSIAEYLDKKCAEIDACIDEKKQQISVLETYKKSIIFEYVTGKKEVI